MNITKARRPIAVVDERTHRQAARALDLLMTSGEDGEYADLVKAHAVCIAATLWLRYEIRTGRKSRRARRAAQIEQWELTLQEVRSTLGLPGGPR